MAVPRAPASRWGRAGGEDAQVVASASHDHGDGTDHGNTRPTGKETATCTRERTAARSTDHGGEVAEVAASPPLAAGRGAGGTGGRTTVRSRGSARLVAVAPVYLAIEVHGDLLGDDPLSGNV